MMHTIWKGAISFGLVHVPVKMHSATEDKDIPMKYIHKPCGSPIGYVRHCASCGKEAEWEDIVKGYEFESGKIVIFEKEELEQIAPEKNKEIRILDFVDGKNIDPVYYQKTYYLSPGETGVHAYTLLREAMKRTGKIGIAQVTIRAKSSLAAIRVIGDCLAMETLFYADEVRPVDQVPNVPVNRPVNDKELEMAEMLIERLSSPFLPDKYEDDYRNLLLERIHGKVAGEEVRVIPEQKPKAAAHVIDLMSALQASIEAISGAKAPSGKPKAGTKRRKAQETVSNAN